MTKLYDINYRGYYCTKSAQFVVYDNDPFVNRLEEVMVLLYDAMPVSRHWKNALTMIGQTMFCNREGWLMVAVNHDTQEVDITTEGAFQVC